MKRKETLPSIFEKKKTNGEEKTTLCCLSYKGLNKNYLVITMKEEES